MKSKMNTKSMEENNNKYQEDHFIGIWRTIGIALFTGAGVAVSITTGNSAFVGIGAALGASCGLVTVSLIETKYKNDGKLFSALPISLLLYVAITIPMCSQKKSTEDIESRISYVENEVWNNINVDMLDKIYDPDCILHVGSNTTMEGTQGLKQMVKMFHELFPDRKFQIDEIFSAGNKIIERYTWHGTHTITGKSVNVSGSIIYNIKDGKIVEVWNFEDMFGLYQQLGIVNIQALFGQS